MADKENGFVLGFFEEFLEEYMPSNSSYFVVSERHSGGIITSVIIGVYRGIWCCMGYIGVYGVV